MAACNNEIKKIQEVVTLRKQQSDQVKKEEEEKAAAAAEAAATAVPECADCIVLAVEPEPLCQRTLDVASEGGAEMRNKKLKTGVSTFLVQYSYRYSRYQCWCSVFCMLLYCRCALSVSLSYSLFSTIFTCL